LWVYRYALSAIRQQAGQLIKQGAKAVILVADSTAQSKIGFFGHGMEEGYYGIEGMEGRAVDAPPVILVTQKWAAALQKSGATASLDLKVNQFDYPSANVVAKAEGTDAQLKKEYVLFSGHHDHDGVGEPVEGDSIWNGADDNATVSVALLAIGRAWVEQPGGRSALFVWHGAEERGLLGSRYFVEHPMVPKASIVAVLNGDMIGRNAEGEAALLGAIPPHRNSQELVDMALNANDALTKFKVDTSWDAESHPEHWYFRSDHLPYARTNIPSIFFTTLLHPDYHTPRDEPETIDINKLTKMTKWMYATGWEVSQTAKKPALETK
ncbi:MAG TPA: M28 family peptidase, partial [Leeuwenhoekiella sp.]|nr:M28 family peptidase [Leeuwenhoekiella sp.]